MQIIVIFIIIITLGVLMPLEGEGARDWGGGSGGVLRWWGGA